MFWCLFAGIYLLSWFEDRSLDKVLSSEPAWLRLAAASDQELLLAAQAVVDAASWSNRVKHNLDFTEEARAALIEAVFRDPTLTRELFD
ncbi:MAG TPA: hypothetical protein PLP17_17015 [Oligoflexia bacterium]|nr:hypothetical protein [Oligoflexia bacterium]